MVDGTAIGIRANVDLDEFQRLHLTLKDGNYRWWSTVLKEMLRALSTSNSKNHWLEWAHNTALSREANMFPKRQHINSGLYIYPLTNNHYPSAISAANMMTSPSFPPQFSFISLSSPPPRPIPKPLLPHQFRPHPSHQILVPATTPFPSATS